MNSQKVKSTWCKSLLLAGMFAGVLSACGGGGGNGGGIPEPEPTPDPDPTPEVTTGQVTFSPSWGALPVPSSVRFHFYPGSGAAIVKDCDAAGFNGTLEAGSYKALAYNTDAQNVTFENTDNYATASVRVAPVEVPTRASSLFAQPSTVYVMSWEEIKVEKGGTYAEQPAPRRLVRTVNLTFNVSNASFVASLTGYMNGLLPSVLLSTGEADDDSKASAKDNGIVFDVPMEGSKGTASYTTLGLLNPEKGTAYTCLLMLSATTTDGQEWETIADLSNAISDLFEKNGGSLPVDEPISLELRVNAATVGLSAEVTGWGVGPVGDGTLIP